MKALIKSVPVLCEVGEASEKLHATISSKSQREDLPDLIDMVMDGDVNIMLVQEWS